MSLVRPQLEYSSTVWDPYQQGHIDMLEKVQRRVARYVMGKYRNRSSVGEMIQHLGWKSLKSRRKEARLSMMYKIVNNKVAIDPDEYFVKPSRRSRHMHHHAFAVPSATKDSREWSYFLNTIRDWNSLPPDIAASKSLEIFKSQDQVEPVFSDHLSYVTYFLSALAKSHKTGLTVRINDLDNSVTTSPPSPTTSPLSITTSQLFVTTTQSLAPTSTVPPPKDCKELYDRGQSSTGVYEIEISDSITKSVICDMTTQDGGWTVIQNRHDGTVDFYRTWSQYKNGFGSVETEYWIGNEAIYKLVSLYTSTKLYIEMEDWSSNIKYALYNQFILYSEVQDYRIYVSGYSGTSGDCIDYYDASFGGSKDKFSHNNMKFSTWDEDNDSHPSVNCGETMKGGWWYSECMASNLNGLYLASGTVDSTSMSCKTFGNDYQSLKRVKMMIKGVS
ncbi:hypothetical protein FSP39_001345 [Pinctada imbricata]|uniref:Fibrinogen C-terminal domain-containing protein n=1 Tax=Pinctada imbricata TaxID=66713 RepID=A0AA89BXT7_PINIB|nr:hypothetical protein FSP39_001345 [Pinctada imbricata]